MPQRAASFVLVPGAGGMAWYWHRVVALLAQLGHEADAVDLPGDDEHASLEDYANQVSKVVDSRKSVIVVAQSLGGFTAPMVCEQAAVQGVVLLNAMIPVPGERAGDWWGHTGAAAARVAAAQAGGYGTDFEVGTYFLHDVPEEVLQTAPPPRRQADAVFAHPCRFQRWPERMQVIAAADDRFFPLEFQKRVALQRLGMPVEVIPGGHLAALSQPQAVVEQLLRFESLTPP